MKPDTKAVPLAIAITVGMLANIVAVAVTRPAMPKLQDRHPAYRVDPMPAGLLQLRYIANIGEYEFPEFSATWPTWRRSTNVEDCRPQPNWSFKPCHKL